MSLPFVVGVLALGWVVWWLSKPLFARLPPRRRALAWAGLLGLLSVAFFALRLAPLGAGAALMAGTLLGRGRKAPRTRAGPRARGTNDGMSRAEARRILGVAPDADRAAIDAAHRRLIVAAHPDRGGTDAQAARINEARAVLRRPRGTT